MKPKRISETERAEYERRAAEIIGSIAAQLGDERTEYANPNRYKAIVDAWNAVKDFPISGKWMRDRIAENFGYGSYVTICRIISSHDERISGVALRKSLAGYNRTWEIAETKLA